MRRLFLAILGSLCATSVGIAAESEFWGGFYRSSVPVTPEAIARPPLQSQAETICLKAILEAQARHNIPDNLLLAIGIQEAGRQVNGVLTVWPWTANSHGKGKFFGSKQALEAWVRQTQANGTSSIDVGCMQVNQRWHSDQFSSLENATDPVANVEYAARFLRALHAETGDWWQAAGRYHSSTDTYKGLYLEKLAQNQRLANANIALFQVAAQSVQVQQPATRPAPPQPSINWSSDMTGASGAANLKVLSIYSVTPLKAVLPNYAEAD